MIYFVKYFSKRSCDRFAPSSVKMTDFAFVAGSEDITFTMEAIEDFPALTFLQLSSSSLWRN